MYLTLLHNMKSMNGQKFLHMHSIEIPTVNVIRLKLAHNVVI